MADFADFSIKFGKAFDRKNQVSELIEKLKVTQEEFAAEHDQVTKLLLTLIRRQVSPTWMKNSKILIRLAEIADEKRVEFEWAGNTNGFAQHMRRLRERITDIFDIESRPCSSGQKKYKYTLKDPSFGTDGE